MRKITFAGFYKPLKRCKTCKYRSADNIAGNCDYILMTGHMRNCDPEHCDKYEKGKRIRWKDDDTSQARGWNHRNNLILRK